LPQSIVTFGDYRRWLARFLGIYQPIEARLHAFPEWSLWGIRIGELGHSIGLRRDLAAMNASTEEFPSAPETALPSLPTFAEAFGALYVIEGSKLGGRFILRDLASRLGSEIEGVTAFFHGHGEHSGVKWNAFRRSLDAFLAQHPLEFPNVVAGANSTFASIEKWMSPLRQLGEI
jgi:heme oxygenase